MISSILVHPFPDKSLDILHAMEFVIVMSAQIVRTQ